MEFITYEQEGFVGIITINRPKALNALNSQVLDELSEVFDNVDLATVRALVLTGAGDKSFVAGADIGEILFERDLVGRMPPFAQLVFRRVLRRGRAFRRARERAFFAQAPADFVRRLEPQDAREVVAEVPLFVRGVPVVRQPLREREKRLLHEVVRHVGESRELRGEKRQQRRAVARDEFRPAGRLRVRAEIAQEGGGSDGRLHVDAQCAMRNAKYRMGRKDQCSMRKRTEMRWPAGAQRSERRRSVTWCRPG